MKKINPQMLEAIGSSMEITLPLVLSKEELHATMTQYIDHLINHDFEKLVFLLYRIDVDESKMRALLAQKEGENAAVLIADLIIERQLQKLKSRREFRQRDNDIHEDEKW